MTTAKVPAPVDEGNGSRGRTAGVEDVAAHFGVTDRTVRRWLKDTDIPHSQPGGPGGAIRFDLEEVIAWAARGGRETALAEEGVA